MQALGLSLHLVPWDPVKFSESQSVACKNMTCTEYYLVIIGDLHKKSPKNPFQSSEFRHHYLSWFEIRLIKKKWKNCIADVVPQGQNYVGP
jgi:hypothetical protein